MHKVHIKKLQSYILNYVTKPDKVTLVVDDVVLVLMVFDCDLVIGCVFQPALAAALPADEQQSIPELRQVLISGYILCLGVLLKCPDISQNMKFVSTDLRQVIIWRGPFLLEVGLPTWCELSMSFDGSSVPAVDVVSRLLALGFSPWVS